jgi:hypothetical protein
MSNLNVSGIGPEIKVLTGTPPVAQSGGAVNGTGVDRLGLDSMVLDVECGAVTGTPTSFSLDCKVQHSDDNSTFADWQPAGTAISGAIAQITTASSRKRKTVNLQGAKRYVRSVTTVAFVGGTTPTCPNAAVMVFGSPMSLPAQLDD